LVASAAKAGIPRERKNGMRALRHFYASALLDAGESIKALADLGHSDAGFTLRTYTHLMPSSEERTRKAIDRAFGYDPVHGLVTAWPVPRAMKPQLKRMMGAVHQLPVTDRHR